MHGDAIPAVAAIISIIIAPAAALSWRVMRKRALRRNAANACGVCGTPWTDIGVAAHEHQVHGVRICAPCAHRLRRRTVVEFAALALTTAITAGITAVAFPKYLPWTPWWAMVWLASPPVLMAAATSWTIHRMKMLNRQNSSHSGDGPAELGETKWHEAPRHQREVTDRDRKLLAQAT
ncbi:MAG TPA: hypothetical protein VN706_19745 [Gemmatimonadaceae bacterium]|nr:hypothetical protein [Gemmatimonadaceae bacterium]